MGVEGTLLSHYRCFQNKVWPNLNMATKLHLVVAQQAAKSHLSGNLRMNLTELPGQLAGIGADDCFQCN